MKALFLDRDGTLVKDYPDDSWRTINRLEIFTDTIPALLRLQEKFSLFIITNQYLIQEGIISEERFRLTHREFLRELAAAGVKIEQTYYCPHPRSINCGCRKPDRGMIDQCLLNYDIDLENSYLVGDSPVDIKLGKSVGCHTVAVGDYLGREQPIYRAENMRIATDLILG